MTAAELLHVYTSQTNLGGLAENYKDVKAEVDRRLKLVDEATEDQRIENMQRFAFSAATVVTNLWAAHGGREMKDQESAVFAKTLFEFFKELSKT